jgi:endonuclease-3
MYRGERWNGKRFLPGKANFRGKHGCMAGKRNAERGEKNRRRYAVFGCAFRFLGLGPFAAMKDRTQAAAPGKSGRRRQIRKARGGMTVVLPAEKAPHLIAALKKAYPEAGCSLHYGKDYELLFSVRLAAQCTDARVNLVAETLFADYPTLEAFAKAGQAVLEEAVRPCGFFRIKARDIIASARMLLAEFGGRVPDNMDDLLRLPGVGRKTANLILGDVYGKGGVVVDTHCLRLANRLGLCKTDDPYKVEKALCPILPREEQSAFCHALVLHGRAVCSARKARCEECCLRTWCDRNGL